MTIFQNYIKSKREKGYYAFTTSEALLDLKVSRNAFVCGMYKLRKKGDIVSPAKNLYVIVPPEYNSLGCLPADELIPILMKHWGLDYYVCLLSAALYHGASHQKPQVFQVMVNKQLKPLICGKVKIEFIYKKSIAQLPTKKIVVKTGYLIIAEPELTAMDLLLYSDRVGGLSHIATVLTELVDVIDPEKMFECVRSTSGKVWVQRLGYILEHIDPLQAEKRDKIVELISHYLSLQVTHYVALASELPVKNMPKNNRWKIIENSTIESDV